VDPQNPASWNRYAYACDPLGVVGPLGACTINVSVSGSAASEPLLSAAEKRVNQIFAATPTSAGEITQVAFDTGGSGFHLELSGTFNPLRLGVHPGGTSQALVYVGSVDYFSQNYSPAGQQLAVGTTAAHELLHAVTGLPDEGVADAPSIPDILTADLAQRMGLQDSVMFSLTEPIPSMYSKLSTQQANLLYSVCMKLERPSTASSGGGGGVYSGGGPDGNWWFWYLEFLNGQPQPEPKPDPCPNGDCRH